MKPTHALNLFFGGRQRQPLADMHRHAHTKTTFHTCAHHRQDIHTRAHTHTYGNIHTSSRADVFQYVVRLAKQLAASLARPAGQQQEQQQLQLEMRMEDAAGDGYRQG